MHVWIANPRTLQCPTYPGFHFKPPFVLHLFTHTPGLLFQPSAHLFEAFLFISSLPCNLPGYFLLLYELQKGGQQQQLLLQQLQYGSYLQQVQLGMEDFGVYIGSAVSLLLRWRGNVVDWDDSVG